ncbi:hypothetical protein BU24DRAFT_419278 [Aaosphaeria arxii CBS 175.79]|uniref:Uncharacterized protein n=1 Tax=Aaosphaeria arxii CBS 175.79 TaxID=1450172 RepID=A0A6A5Y320_9PLEO|nr:uncharacterized protein BU24DRAFT_419278 [Aaosphaeria arxii CBS 175.79]KAF2019659.1 hypothetical protein BU24DRAFT_419278 [Aaosphaeria arxii CBS 175.79]
MRNFSAFCHRLATILLDFLVVFLLFSTLLIIRCSNGGTLNCIEALFTKRHAQLNRHQGTDGNPQLIQPESSWACEAQSVPFIACMTSYNVDTAMSPSLRVLCTLNGEQRLNTN